MLEIQEMQLEKDDDDPNAQPRCNQDKIELDERYFIEIQWKGEGLQIALQLAAHNILCVSAVCTVSATKAVCCL